MEEDSFTDQEGYYNNNIQMGEYAVPGKDDHLRLNL